MQNLLLSKLPSAILGLLGSGESVWLRNDFCLDLPADLTVIVIEITIARIIRMNKTGSPEIKLNDRGKTGWIVGPAITGEGEVRGFGSKVGVDVLGEIVGLGSVNEVACKFGTYCSLSSIE